MDEQQLKYKRLFDYSDDDMQYKDYRVMIQLNNHKRKEIVHACCRQHAWDLVWKPMCKILSIKIQ